MGLGKTFQACAAIYTLLNAGITHAIPPAGVIGGFCVVIIPGVRGGATAGIAPGAGNVEGKPTVLRPLILCPSSLVGNWGKVRKSRHLETV